MAYLGHRPADHPDHPHRGGVVMPAYHLSNPRIGEALPQILGEGSGEVFAEWALWVERMIRGYDYAHRAHAFGPATVEELVAAGKLMLEQRRLRRDTAPAPSHPFQLAKADFLWLRERI